MKLAIDEMSPCGPDWTGVFVKVDVGWRRLNTYWKVKYGNAV